MQNRGRMLQHRGKEVTAWLAKMIKSTTEYVLNTLISENVFGYLEHELKIDHELQDVAKMALLKYYSELSDMNKIRTETAIGLIEELSKAGYVFAFYQKFAGRLRLPLFKVWYYLTTFIQTRQRHFRQIVRALSTFFLHVTTHLFVQSVLRRHFRRISVLKPPLFAKRRLLCKIPITLSRCPGS